MNHEVTLTMRIKDILLKTVASTGKGIAAVMIIVLSFFLLSVSHAYADIIYENDFEYDADLSGWTISDDSAGALDIDTIPYGWTSFLGEFGEYDAVSLTLTGLSEGWLTLSFDVFFIRSWDGNDPVYGVDYFTVMANDMILLNETFSNGNQAGQSYGDDSEKIIGYNDDGTAIYEAMTGSELQWALGYWFEDGIYPENSDWMDSVYTFVYTFNNIDETLILTFASNSWQDITDESWGLDNVSVELSSVPEPATLLLLASGAFGLIPLSRRRKRN